MTINVHADHDRYAERDDMTEVGRTVYFSDSVNEFERIDYARTEATCLHPMRGWTALHAHGGMHTHHGFCLLDKGHRGRHSTVVFYCDGCDRTLRGRPATSNDDVSFCFMCGRGKW